MRYFLHVQLFLLLILTSTQSFSQIGLWTWISGSNALGSGGSYGIQGVPSVNNYPPAQSEYVTWKDLQGNFWLYGGYDSLLADLWKYNPSTNEWTWVKGNGLPNQSPVYGTLGVSDPTNSPGSRQLTSCTWVDANGNFWLFGGDYYRNDLWKYNISTNEWTWINGTTATSGVGNYGTPGVPSPTNLPPGRAGTCAAWIDSLDNFWLFGGDRGAGTYLNDVWRYSISTNEWTWMTGLNAPNDPGYYGSKGVSDPVNRPAARAWHSKGQDHFGNFWIIGGIDGNAAKEDVWKFDPGINQWIWMAGTGIDWDDGLYQNTCKLDTLNRPGCRSEASCVTDSCGRIWMFGGYTGVWYNDLWVFDPYTLRWMWVSGTNVGNRPNHYGTKGNPDPANSPASRARCASWWGDDGKFYMFGGDKSLVRTPSFGGLWVFEPDNRCIPPCGGALPVADFSARNEVCAGECIDYTNLSQNASYYQWNFTGATNPNSTNENPQNVCYYITGTYDVILIAMNGVTRDTLTTSITVYPTPSPQSIFQNGDTLFANPGASTYSWILNSVLISGATDYFYVATQSGNYQVVSVDNHGCESQAWAWNVIAGLPQFFSDERVSVFPNPAEESLYVIGYTLFGTANEVSIFNMLGEKMITYSLDEKNQQQEFRLDVRSLTPGVYWLRITTEEKKVQVKFLKR